MRRTKALEKNPDEEFDFFLAERLGMTVAELRHTMGAREHLYWQMYYARKHQNQQLAAAKAQSK